MSGCQWITGLLLAFVCLAAGPGTQPATAPVDPALWKRMVEIDARGSKIVDLTADFRQEKFTPLLKKPLTSSGVIRASTSVMMWETKLPEPTRMRIDEKEMRLFYPRQNVMEIYPIVGQLGALAASPLPRLDQLKKYFSFQEAGPAELFTSDAAANRLALRLSPLADEVRQYVDHVIVLLDTERGLILGSEVVDADGDRTVIRFSSIQINRGLQASAFELNIPADARITRPLENFGPPPKH